MAAEPAADSTEDASAVSESVMGKALPVLAEIPEVEQVSDTMTYEEYKNRPYDARAYRGAKMLDMDPAFVHGIQVGIEKVYTRDYAGARAHFKELEASYPGTAIAPVADTLIWQAIMLENFDFSKEDQYWKSTEKATESLKNALKTEGNQAIEHFLMAGIQGVESIHMMRKFQFIPALQRAFSAMGNIEECREIAPDFVDLKFADGMYHYWRTVVTMSSKLLPDFGDYRTQGIQEMMEVEVGGVLLNAPSTLSLAFVWHEQGNLKKALASCARNRKAYPDNIINNLVTGSTYTFLRKYDSAISVFNEILEDDPNNRRVHYWLGLAHQRSGKPEIAMGSYQTYLNFKTLEESHRAQTHYRIGQLHIRKKRYPEAYTSYREASKINGHKGAKKSLDRMKDRKKKGEITY
jgi:hypothetical protein